VNYDRTLYKEDLPAIKRKLKSQTKEEQYKVPRSAQKKPPNQGLQLEFVHG
jgi:hypothetical protein